MLIFMWLSALVSGALCAFVYVCVSAHMYICVSVCLCQCLEVFQCLYEWAFIMLSCHCKCPSWPRHCTIWSASPYPCEHDFAMWLCSQAWIGVCICDNYVFCAHVFKSGLSVWVCTCICVCVFVYVWVIFKALPQQSSQCLPQLMENCQTVLSDKWEKPSLYQATLAFLLLIENWSYLLQPISLHINVQMQIFPCH